MPPVPHCLRSSSSCARAGWTIDHGEHRDWSGQSTITYHALVDTRHRLSLAVRVRGHRADDAVPGGQRPAGFRAVGRPRRRRSHRSTQREPGHNVRRIRPRPTAAALMPIWSTTAASGRCRSVDQRDAARCGRRSERSRRGPARSRRTPLLRRCRLQHLPARDRPCSRPVASGPLQLRRRRSRHLSLRRRVRAGHRPIFGDVLFRRGRGRQRHEPRGERRLAAVRRRAPAPRHCGDPGDLRGGHDDPHRQHGLRLQLQCGADDRRVRAQPV